MVRSEEIEGLQERILRLEKELDQLRSVNAKEAERS